MTSLLFGRTGRTMSNSRKSQRDRFRIGHLPHKTHNSASGETASSAKQPAHGRLIVNSSTTGRVTPARSYIFSIFHDAGDSRVIIRVGEHLCATCLVVLCVVVDEWNAFRVVEITSLLTVRTSRLGVNN